MDNRLIFLYSDISDGVTDVDNASALMDCASKRNSFNVGKSALFKAKA